MASLEEIKEAIVAYAGKGKKTKFYFKDMEKAVKKVFPDVKSREVKKAATALVQEGVLEYFSTGSSTMYGMKGRGISAEKSATGE